MQVLLILLITLLSTGCSPPKSRFLQVSSSMEPTVCAGDIVVVDNSAYINKTPGRGDIIFYKTTGNTGLSRIAGLPNESIAIAHGVVLVNNEDISLLKQIYYTSPTNAPFGINGAFLIPSNSYFVLCDNSVISKDSRYIGSIPVSNIVGKVIEIKLASNKKSTFNKSEIKKSIILPIKLSGQEEIVVAAMDLPAGTILTRSHLAKDRKLKDRIPSNSVLVSNVSDLIGSRLTCDIIRGQAILTEMLDKGSIERRTD